MLSRVSLYPSLAVRDLKEAIAFYRDTLGFNIVDENRNGVWFEAGSSRFTIYESAFAGSNKGTAMIFEVIDPDSEVKALKSRGITFEHYDNIPDIHREGEMHVVKDFRCAWFKDPSGNILSIGTHL